jgi:hypothetical protein
MSDGLMYLSRRALVTIVIYMTLSTYMADVNARLLLEGLVTSGLDRPTAVHRKHSSRYEACLIGSQKGDRIGDIIGHCKTAEGN